MVMPACIETVGDRRLFNWQILRTIKGVKNNYLVIIKCKDWEVS